MRDSHWHITLVCDELSLPSVIAIDEVEAILEQEKMEAVVENVTGLQIINRSEDGLTTTFFGGHTVKRWVCNRSCLQNFGVWNE